MNQIKSLAEIGIPWPRGPISFFLFFFLFFVLLYRYEAYPIPGRNASPSPTPVANIQNTTDGKVVNPGEGKGREGEPFSLYVIQNNRLEFGSFYSARHTRKWISDPPNAFMVGERCFCRML